MVYYQRHFFYEEERKYTRIVNWFRKNEYKTSASNFSNFEKRFLED